MDDAQQQPSNESANTPLLSDTTDDTGDVNAEHELLLLRNSTKNERSSSNPATGGNENNNKEERRQQLEGEFLRNMAPMFITEASAHGGNNNKSQQGASNNNAVGSGAATETDAMMDRSTDQDMIDVGESRSSCCSSWLRCCGSFFAEAHTESLSRASTTPLCWAILIPLLTLATHALFFYGQYVPMWRLVVQAHVNVTANATDFTSRTAFDALGIPTHNSLQYNNDTTVRTFTYSYAITELWQAHGIPGKVLPRVAAVLLIIFSGFWPHLKLLMLNTTFLFGSNATRRSRVLHWLSCLGKWSLADVLVVCVMVGVLNLDWNVEPDNIKTGMIDNLPIVIKVVKSMYKPVDLCGELLHYTCHSPPIAHLAACKACEGFVDIAYSRPNWARSTGRSIVNGVATSGGGLVNLRVVGMKGIYTFSAAVIISILLSLIVDVLDMKLKKHKAKVERQRQLMTAALQEDQNNIGQRSAEFYSEDRMTVELRRRRQERANRSWLDNCGPFLSIVTTIMVFLAIGLPSIQRRVHGAIPQLLHDIFGVEWTKEYSLRTLMRTTGQFGGWDYLLMATFSLFIVFGPALRASLNLLNFLVGCCFAPDSVFSEMRLSILLPIIDFVGAFCAWEVFTVAIIMVQLLMPSITATIINRPECKVVADDGQCLEMEFAVQNVFVFVIVGGILLVAVSYIAVRPYKNKYTHLDNHGSARPSTTAGEATREVMEEETLLFSSSIPGEVNISGSDEEPHIYIRLTDTADTMENNNAGLV